MRITCLFLPAALVALGTACGGGDCLNKAPSEKACAEGSQGYGREADGGTWAFDLASWALDGYDEKGSCEVGCVPKTWGDPALVQECDTFEPCGGKLVGDWRWDRGCPYDVPVTLWQGCPDALQSRTRMTDGTLTIDNDGTFALTYTKETLDETLLLPPQCVNTLNTCDDVDGIGQCTGELETGCYCSTSTDAAGSTLTGQWEVTGKEVTFTAGIDTVWTSAFCVDGETLWFDTPLEDHTRREILIRFGVPD